MWGISMPEMSKNTKGNKGWKYEEKSWELKEL